MLEINSYGEKLIFSLILINDLLLQTRKKINELKVD